MKHCGQFGKTMSNHQTKSINPYITVTYDSFFFEKPVLAQSLLSTCSVPKSWPVRTSALFFSEMFALPLVILLTLSWVRRSPHFLRQQSKFCLNAGESSFAFLFFLTLLF
jgi:hypothetical protein